MGIFRDYKPVEISRQAFLIPLSGFAAFSGIFVY